MSVLINVDELLPCTARLTNFGVLISASFSSISAKLGTSLISRLCRHASDRVRVPNSSISSQSVSRVPSTFSNVSHFAIFLCHCFQFIGVIAVSNFLRFSLRKAEVQLPTGYPSQGYWQSKRTASKPFTVLASSENVSGSRFRALSTSPVRKR